MKSATTVSTEFIYDAEAIDPQGGTITYSLGTAPIDAVINSQTGLIRWSAVTDGTYTFSVNATDSLGATATQTFTVTVQGTTVTTVLEVAPAISPPLAAPTSTDSTDSPLSGSSASVVVTSSASDASSNDSYDVQSDTAYVVINVAAEQTEATAPLLTGSVDGSTTLAVNWEGEADSLIAAGGNPPTSGDGQDWLTQLLNGEVAADTEDLLTDTGLVVML